jgi:long-chain fatty acid transport protein
MKRVINHSKTIIWGLCLSGVSASVSAAGFQLNEQSTSGLGRAFSGDAAIADNASAISRNPALGVLFKDSQISLGATYIDPNIDVEGTTSIGEISISETSDDIAPSAVVPYGYFTAPIKDNISFGLALNSYFGLKTDYSDDFPALSLANDAEITAIYVTPSLAWKIDELFSIGVGLNIVSVDASISSSIPNTSNDVLSLEGSDGNHGWHIGMAWTVNNSLNIGLSHRSTIDLKLSGTARSDVQNFQSGAKLNFELPSTTELSAAYNITPHWLLSFTAAETSWTSFQGLEAYLETGTMLEVSNAKWEDSRRYALGITYSGCEKWAYRVGFSIDESATDIESRRLSIPDTDRRWFTVGATYHLDDKSNLDFAIGYIGGDEAPIEDAGQTGTSFSGEQSGSVNLFGLSYNQSF